MNKISVIQFILRWLLTIFFILVLSFLGWSAVLFFTFVQTKIDFTPETVVSVAKGKNMTQIARMLYQKTGAGKSWQWILLAKFKQIEHKIKLGDYQLTGQMTPAQILDKMVRGDVRLYSIRIPEGMAFYKLRKWLQQYPFIKITTPPPSSKQLAAKLKLDYPNVEGLFFPDTYHVVNKSTDIQLFSKAAQHMQGILMRLWEKRARHLPLNTPYEALILASIVEKETGLERDRPLIASVFINRLRKNIPLQSDPTVIYGIGPRFNGNLTRKDLRRPTAYNTYTIAALPPTPIATVSLASLKAVLNPPKTDYYYFVARGRGDGSSEFSKNLSEHNAAVARYQKK